MTHSDNNVSPSQPVNFGDDKSPAKVIMTLLVRDEADIIRSHIEYHLTMGVDLILVIDNDSNDGTTAILKEYQNSGKLVYFHEPSHEYLQDIWVTQLAQRAYLQYNADWIINGDADEFFIPKDGTLKDVLKKVHPKVNVISIKRHDMVPVERPGVLAPPIEMVYRKRESLEWVIGHPIVDKVIHRGMPDLQVRRGSHSITSAYIINQVQSEDIFIFHYPIRSYPQFENKVRNVGSGRVKNNLIGSRYDSWYSALLTGDLENVYRGYQLKRDQMQKKLESKDIIEERKVADILTKLL